jgi:hypothetical protein
MDGVLTERVSLDVETITALAQSVVAAAFRAARGGILFNAMNANVEWQRDDLFHWPLDALAKFPRRQPSERDLILRRDICLVFAQPRRWIRD